jgi:transcriptional regulator with XRE-family HTH domain
MGRVGTKRREALVGKDLKMFRNLEAEQARKHMTNQQVAEAIGMSRVSYESKKKSGKFTVPEIKKLCALYQSDFTYLFETK